MKSATHVLPAAALCVAATCVSPLLAVEPSTATGWSRVFTQDK